MVEFLKLFNLPLNIYNALPSQNFYHRIKHEYFELDITVIIASNLYVEEQNLLRREEKISFNITFVKLLQRLILCDSLEHVNKIRVL